MTALAIIGARAGSKGVPDKNIRTVAHRSLLAWSIAACQRAGLRVVVSTDSSAYAEHAARLGAEVIGRPPQFATDHSPDYEFIEHALRHIENCPPLIAHIRPTTPLRDPAVIDEAIRVLERSPWFTSLRSVHTMSESAYKAFEISEGGALRNIARLAADDANDARQRFPTTYTANGYVDVLRTDYVRWNGKLHGPCVLPFITEPVIEVDTEEDFARLEYEIVRNPRHFSRVFG